MNRIKKLMTIILSVVIFVTCLPLSDIKIKAANNPSVNRYSVLVLDVSHTAEFIGKNGQTIYTADTAIDYVKESAKSFLADLVNARGNNYVAVVAYAENATIVSDFTQNISEVTNEISTLTSHDTIRNISAGLEAANKLMSSVDSSAIKNVVLVTTGMTNAGDYLYDGHYDDSTVGSIWRRNDTQVRLYAYANKAYESAMSIKDNSTLYVLGLFKTMENIPDEGKDIAEFFKLTALDLATSADTFYEVDDPDDVEFVFGNIADEINNQNGHFKYAGQINKDSDSESDYWYSDSYFKRSATQYNASLATMSLCLELSTWSSYDYDNWYNPSFNVDDRGFWNDKLHNVKALLIGNPSEGEGYEGIGFSNFSANNFWQSTPTKDSIGVCAARKQITDNKGKKYTLIALVIRGGGYGAEWASNFTLGKDGEHDGFATARDNVLSFLDTYISGLNTDESKNIKVWVTGFSRAGATANMVAGALDSYHRLPAGATTSIEDVYCYTFEAPQGAKKSELSGYYGNIFNVLNLNDLVPLVAPRSWDFARYNYQNDKPTPSKYTTGSEKYSRQEKAMFEQLRKLGYAGFDYKINETSTMKNFKVDKSSFWPGGDPLWWFEESSVDTNAVLNKGIDFLANDVIESREYYNENLEYCVRQLMGIFMDYYGIESGLSNYGNEVATQAFMLKLDELFTFENVTYILAPMFSLNPFKSYDSRVHDVKVRLGKKIGGIFAEYAQIDGFISAITDILGNVFIQVVEEVWDNNTDSINTVIKLVNTLVSSEFQGHFPEICLAWCRSLDSNYNNEIEDSNGSVTRIIRINCPVNVNVYDSNDNLVASIVEDVADESIDGIINYVNNKGEKLFFLPGDENYRIDMVATAAGNVNISLGEYNFVYNQVVRLQNYYDINVSEGDGLKVVVPEIIADELIENDINGSNAEYVVNYKDILVAADETFLGEEISNETYKVEVVTDGNGGYAQGTGTFLTGSFAKVEAQTLPNAKFLGWYVGDELVSTDMTYRFAVKSDVVVTAKFSDIKYNDLKFEIDGKGIIESIEDGSYPADIKIGVKAIAADGYKFVGWTSSNGGTFNDATETEAIYMMSGKDTVVVAHFEPVNSKSTTGQATIEGNVEMENTSTQIENNSAQTGDNNSMFLVVLLIFASLVVISAVQIKKSVNRNN